MDAYRNASLSADDRTADLMARMTLEEKAAQTERHLGVRDPLGDRLRRREGGVAHGLRHRADYPARRREQLRSGDRRRARERDPALPRRAHPARAFPPSFTRNRARATSPAARDVFPQTIGIASSFDDGIASEMGTHHPRADARARRPPGARAPPRHYARPALGAHRGKPSARTASLPPEWASRTSRGSRAIPWARGILATGEALRRATA